MVYGFFLLYVSLLPPVAFSDAYSDALSRVNAASSPHEALGVSAGASEAEVKTAHRRLVLLFHGPADRGDREALTVMQYVNSARDYLLKPPVEGGRRSGWSGPRGSSTTAGAQGPRGQERRSEESGPWEKFWNDLRAAPDLQSKIDLRNLKLNEIARERKISPQELEHLVYQDFLSLQPQTEYRNAIANWLLNNIHRVDGPKMRGDDWRRLHSVLNPEPRQGYMIFRRALEMAESPDQILDFLQPRMGMATGGAGWIKQLEAAARDSLYHFFTLRPSPQQVQRLQGLLAIGFDRGVGEELFRAALRGKPSRESFVDPASARASHCSWLYRKVQEGMRIYNRMIDSQI